MAASGAWVVTENHVTFFELLPQCFNLRKQQKVKSNAIL